jgi:acetate kinase
MTQHILTLNAGSSSSKFSLFGVNDGAMTMLAIGQVEGLGTRPRFTARDGAGQKLVDRELSTAEAPDHTGALAQILAFFGQHFPQARIVAVGHRVVHGGLAHVRPVLLDEPMLAALAKLEPLAPLHQPHNLAGVRAAQAAFPAVPQVACFDTAFHRAQPFVNDAFAIPRALYDEGVRRYGFHGLSYEYISRRLREVAPLHAAGRVIVAHLGSGASMCAMRDGLSVASTMGFSPLDGLPMGTRPGQLDPGVLLYLLDEKKLDGKAIADLLYKQSGLKGLSCVSNDMRDLEASSDPRAKQAIDYFVFRARREIGGMAAVLEGLDAIVFCGGIGENARGVRENILEGMEWLGVELDPSRNRANEMVISSDRSRVRVFVIPTNEELMIAEHARRVAGIGRRLAAE